MFKRLFGKSTPKSEFDPELGYPYRNVTDPRVREAMAILDTALKNFLVFPEGREVVENAQKKYSVENVLKMSIEERVRFHSAALYVLVSQRLNEGDTGKLREILREFRRKHEV